MSPADLTSITGLVRHCVDQMLHRMVAEGEIIRVSKGRYVHAKRLDLIPGRKSEVATSEQDLARLRKLLAVVDEASPVSETPAATSASDTIADGFQPMTKEEFIKASVQNCRALVREAYAESKVRVSKYLETGDLADLFPERKYLGRVLINSDCSAIAAANDECGPSSDAVATSR
jgi:hypothetical protein